MNDDLISVTIPAYNHEKYVEECIRSIMAQTYQNIELLVIDDGSKDKTFEVLKSLKSECEKRFVRVVFETQENQGVVATINKLQNLLSGSYVYFVASDDVSKPKAIETLHTFLSGNSDYVLAVGDNEIIDGNSKRTFWDKERNNVSKEEATFITFGDCLGINGTDKFGQYKTLLKNNHIPNGFLIRRSALKSLSSDTILEDWVRNLQLIKEGKFKYFPEVLFSYRWHETNTVKSSSYQNKQQAIYKQVLENEKAYAFANGYEKEWKRIWCRRFGWRAKWKKLRDMIRGKK